MKILQGYNAKKTENDFREKPIDTEKYLANLKKRTEIAKKEKRQGTYHQHLAIETAKALGDTKSLGIYFRLFKRYNPHDLEKCKNWVLSKTDTKNKGRLFVSVYRKFIH